MLYIILENRVEDVSSVTTHAVTQPSKRSHLARAKQSLSSCNAVTQPSQRSHNRKTLAYLSAVSDGDRDKCTLSAEKIFPLGREKENVTRTGDKRLVVSSKCRTFAAPTTQKTPIWTEPKNLS